MSFSSIEFPSAKSDVYASDGMVATSQPLAAQAGLDILAAGGNAIDAAIATAAVLTVVEPCSNGLGGDAFALIWSEREQKLFGLNASGPSPSRLTREIIIEAGYDTEMPKTGALPVTVPGAVEGWEAAIERFGSRRLDTLLFQAIRYAEDGFPLSPYIASSWARAKEKMSAYPESEALWFPGGSAPKAGETFTNEKLGKSLRAIASEGSSALYRGWIGEDIVNTVKRYGGVMEMSDLVHYTPEWVLPLSVNYGDGFTFHEIPPNGQGLAALLALNIADGFDLRSLPFDSSERAHLMIEAMKLGYIDAQQYIADPKFGDVPVEELLSPEYTKMRRDAIKGGVAINPQPGLKPGANETVYLTVADRYGNMVSWIQSNYMGFGSGLTAPESGIPLQNRGANFSLDPEHPNVVAGKKRPFHTIIPGFISREGTPFASYGVMGGFMQPQGHLQVGLNLVDLMMSPQHSLNAPRWQWLRGKEVALEEALWETIKPDLERWGHEIISRESTDRTSFGGGQVILRDGESFVGGTEPRNDGMCVGRK